MYLKKVLSNTINYAYKQICLSAGLGNLKAIDLVDKIETSDSSVLHIEIIEEIANTVSEIKHWPRIVENIYNCIEHDTHSFELLDSVRFMTVHKLLIDMGYVKHEYVFTRRNYISDDYIRRLKHYLALAMFEETDDGHDPAEFIRSL